MSLEQTLLAVVSDVLRNSRWLTNNTKGSRTKIAKSLSTRVVKAT